MPYLVRDKVFAIGDDSWIEDGNGDKAFLLDGKALRLRQTYELKDTADQVVAKIRKKAIALRDTMVVERDGETLATVHKKVLHLLRERFVVELAGGAEWSAHGNFLDKEYEIEGDQGKVAQISKKWLRIRDTYAVEVADGPDVALVLAVAVAIDALAEPGRDH